MKNGRKKLVMISIVVIVLCMASVSSAHSEEYSIGTAASRTVVKEETIIPYATEHVTDTTLAPGSDTRVIQEGKNGVKTVTYLVDYEDGVEKARGIEDVSVTNPVNEIIGVAPNPGDITSKEETTTETIYYKTETVNDPNRIKGEPDQVVQEGKHGSREITYTVYYMNGTEISRTEKSRRTITPATNKIISVATGEYDVSYYTETVVIPFVTINKDSDTIYKGETYVEKEGSDGEKEVTYAIYKDKNGKEVSRSVYSEKITKDVVNKIIYQGTVVHVVTYTVVDVPDLPECDPTKRTSSLNEDCVEWAMTMAQENRVYHSGTGATSPYAESVGGWGNIDEVVYGRQYTTIGGDGQTYSGIVSLGSHGGESLTIRNTWGAGCVARTETLPNGKTQTIYYACARGAN